MSLSPNTPQVASDRRGRGPAISVTLSIVPNVTAVDWMCSTQYAFYRTTTGRMDHIRDIEQLRARVVGANGYRVLTADSGLDAVQLRKSHAGEIDPVGIAVREVAL